MSPDGLYEVYSGNHIAGLGLTLHTADPDGKVMLATETYPLPIVTSFLWGYKAGNVRWHVHVHRYPYAALLAAGTYGHYNRPVTFVTSAGGGGGGSGSYRTIDFVLPTVHAPPTPAY